MTRTEAIDILKNTIVRFGRTNGKTAYTEALQMAIQALEEPQWIPWNTGNLPKESGTYTITAYDGVTRRVTHAKYQKRLKRWELTGARAYWRVLAWRPEPEPWEGDVK
jgi:hypothetical protein